MKRLFALTLSLGLVAIMAVPAVANSFQHEYGGGQIIEDDNKISFGGEVNSDLVGDFQVNLHNVPGDTLDGSRFHSTSVVEANWYAPRVGDDCDAAMNATFMGRFDGIDGFKLIFRAGDNVDTVRFTLYTPSGAVFYDTYGTGSGFSPESHCVGTARTGLDRGDVTIAR